MLLLKPENTGLTFHEWQDAIHDVPDGSTIGSPFHDPLLSIADQEYLRLELWYRGGYLTGGTDLLKTELPKVLEDKRGIGNWQNPKVILVFEKIKTHLKKASPLWFAIPRYRRLRPMSNSIEERTKLIGLLQAASSERENKFLSRNEKELLNCYITTFEKPWLYKLLTSTDAFVEELSYFRQRIPAIFIGRNEIMNKIWHLVGQTGLYHIPTFESAKNSLRRIISR